MCIIVREWQIGLNEERSQQRISSQWDDIARLVYSLKKCLIKPNVIIQKLTDQ